MKPYGLRSSDYDCCFGHSKFPTHWHGRFHNTEKNNLIRKAGKARERRKNKMDYNEITALANMEPEEDDEFDFSELGDEYDKILTCEIGLDAENSSVLDGAILHRDADDGSIMLIKDANGKTIGKLYIYDE